jgi:hypothetical protein
LLQRIAALEADNAKLLETNAHLAQLVDKFLRMGSAGAASGTSTTSTRCCPSLATSLRCHHRRTSTKRRMKSAHVAFSAWRRQCSGPVSPNE